MKMYESFTRLCNFLSALLMLICLLPVMGLIALAIRLDSPGPVFYRQIFVGKKGKLFRMYKFRTTLVSENLKANLNEYVKKLLVESEGKGGRWFLDNDPRITRVGRFLRKTSLNELPQLINVLEGDMNLVGPRARLPFEFEKYSKEMLEIFDVPPGITGLWQIDAYRSDMTFQNMVIKDRDYVRSRSIKLDLIILLKTIPAAFKYESY